MVKAREIAVRAGLILGAVLVPFLVGEGVFRVFDIKPVAPLATRYINLMNSLTVRTHPYFPDSTGEIASLYYRYKPNSVWATAYPDNWRGVFNAQNQMLYALNSRGFREREFPTAKPEGTFRILALGDSFTLGEGVKAQDTFPKALEKSLRAACPSCEVLNLGINGYGAHDELVLLKTEAVAFEPDLVVFGYYLNDISHLLTDRLTSQFEEERQRWPLLATRSFLVNWVSRKLWDRHVAQGTIRFLLDLYENERTWVELKKLYLDARDTLARRKARMIVAVFPDLQALRRDPYPFTPIHEKLAAFFKEAGIPTLDLRAAWKAANPETLLVHPVDAHPNEIGQGIVARELQAALLKGDFIPPSYLRRQ